MQASTPGNQDHAQGDGGAPQRTVREMLVHQHELIEEAEQARRNLLLEIAERKRVEETLRQSEQKYRELFESMTEAYCVIELIFDENHKPVDFRYVETNRAFVRHATRPMLGMRIKEIVPDFEQFWLDHYGRVAVTGEPVELEHEVAGLGNQWFHTASYRVGGEHSNKVAVIFESARP